MSIEIDVSQPGVVFIKFDGEQSLDDLDRYSGRMAEVYARAQPYVAITWMKRYARNRETVQRMGRWMKENAHLTKQYCAGASIIVVCGGLAEASRFVREQARLRKLALPPGLRPPWPDVPP